MGLDQQLYRFDKRKDNIPLNIQQEYESGNAEDIKYWRKANQIHAWMNVNIGTVENCEFYIVPKDTLQRLLDTCKNVITEKDGDYNDAHMPTEQGFFFGSDEYDDWYYGELEETIPVLEKCLLETDFETQEIYYWAWW